MRVVEECSELLRSRCLNSLFSFLWHPCVSGIGRNAVEDVLNCPLHVVEGSSKGGLALLSRETHRHQFLDLGFVILRRRLRLWLGSFFFLFWLRNLSCNLDFFWLRLDLFLRLGLRLLHELMATCTCVMTTMKSVSLMANFSIVSSLAAVFPLNTIFKLSAANPLASWILVFRISIYHIPSLTLSAGSTSTWKTYPFRFLIFSFI